jgi:signal transduction histidine kinase
VITVRDTGDGIAPEFLNHLFSRFRQADGTTTRRHGLGLAIVQQLVELHGGTVAAQRRPWPRRHVHRAPAQHSRMPSGGRCAK